MEEMEVTDDRPIRCAMAAAFSAAGPGTDVRILKIFSSKKIRKMSVFTKNAAKLCKNWIIPNIGF
jgi:hypothetical protein